MHRSRVGVMLIDFPGPVHDAGLAFWSGVVGHVPEPEGEPYTSLGDLGSLALAVQRLGSGPARIHLDIESDDVEAEVARVTALGAQVVERPDGYAVLRDPGGLIFCVVGVQTGERFDAEATTWP